MWTFFVITFHAIGVDSKKQNIKQLILRDATKLIALFGTFFTLLESAVS
jgi:hypothetical protein